MLKGGMSNHEVLASLLKAVSLAREAQDGDLSELVLRPSASELDALEDLLRSHLGMEPVPVAERERQKAARDIAASALVHRLLNPASPRLL